jgi:hypothetical protein
MRATALSIGLTLLCTIVLVADDRHVDFDQHTDFSTLKSFALHEGKVNSPNPELNNPLLVRKVGDAIRAALVAKGLRETATDPDLIVDYSIVGEDFSAQRGGPAAFSQGTLVIDLVKREPKTLVWRSVYRDKESTNAKLAQALPRDVRESLSEYPPRQKGVIARAPVTQATPRDISPKAAAASAIEIIQSTRRNTAYVSGAAHPGLNVTFNKLERAASAVVDDDGRSPAATENRISAFYRALKETEEFALSLADRRNEGPDSRARSRDLADKLRSLVAP